MRMTQSMLARSNLGYISNNYKQYSDILDRINSGKKITRPSQDPVVAIKGMAYRSQVDETEQFQRNLIEVSNWIDNTDASLDETTQVLIRIKELTIQASNETYTASQRQGIAEEVKQLQDHLESLGNTVVNQQHIFNGTNVRNKPVDVTNIEANFSESKLGNGTEFHIRYAGSNYTFKHESKDAYVFESGNKELSLSKKSSDIAFIENGKRSDVLPEEVIMSNKGLSDITSGTGKEFAVYYNDKLYTFQEVDADNKVIYQNGDDLLTIDLSTSSVEHIGEEVEAVEESDLSIISTYSDDWSKLNSKNGSKLIVHYQNQPYVFQQEEEGLLVYQNGNQQIQINPQDSKSVTFTNEQNEPEEIQVQDIVISKAIRSDIKPSNGSEMVVQFQNNQYTFERAYEDGENKEYKVFEFKAGDDKLIIKDLKNPPLRSDINQDNGSEFTLYYQEEPYIFEKEENGQLTFRSGDQQIKFNPLVGSISITDDTGTENNLNGTELTIEKQLSIKFNEETLEQSNIIISSKDGISTNKQDFEMEIMKGIKMNVNIRPQNVYSAGLYKDLSDLVKVLEEPSNSGSDVNAFLSKIEGHIDNVINERSDLGARSNRIELIADRLSRQDMVAKQMLSENEDIDFEKVITDLKIQEMVHQAALAVGARIIQPTLMDFLR